MSSLIPTPCCLKSLETPQRNKGKTRKCKILRKRRIKNPRKPRTKVTIRIHSNPRLLNHTPAITPGLARHVCRPATSRCTSPAAPPQSTRGRGASRRSVVGAELQQAAALVSVGFCGFWLLEFLLPFRSRNNLTPSNLLPRCSSSKGAFLCLVRLPWDKSTTEGETSLRFFIFPS